MENKFLREILRSYVEACPVVLSGRQVLRSGFFACFCVTGNLRVKEARTNAEATRPGIEVESPQWVADSVGGLGTDSLPA
jgi:hypothetical protein